MLKAEKFKKEIESFNYMFAVVENKVVKCADLDTCENCEFKTRCGGGKIKWLLEEYEEPILTDKEKEILKNISRCFDNIGHHIITIKKKKCFVDDGSLIFKVKIDAVHHTYSESDLFYLDKKFKGMELEKEYTLEELGL